MRRFGLRLFQMDWRSLVLAQAKTRIICSFIVINVFTIFAKNNLFQQFDLTTLCRKVYNSRVFYDESESMIVCILLADIEANGWF